MKGLYAIYRKELGHYFVSPVAYIIIGLFLLVSAYFFVLILGNVIQQSYQATMESMQYGGGMAFDAPSMAVGGFFGILSTLMLFLAPFLTMGLYSEERKRGTFELLMTSPITETQIVLGKFLAACTLLMIMLLPTAGDLVYLFFHSEPSPPWRVLLSAYIGIFLLGSAIFAIGSFFSSVTESQLIAAMLTFSAILLLWVVGYGTDSTGYLASALQYLSLIRHYDDFTRGVVDTTGLIYYGSFIFLGVFLTVRSVDSMRWRRA